MPWTRNMWIRIVSWLWWHTFCCFRHDKSIELWLLFHEIHLFCSLYLPAKHERFSVYDGWWWSFVKIWSGFSTIEFQIINVTKNIHRRWHSIENDEFSCFAAIYKVNFNVCLLHAVFWYWVPLFGCHIMGVLTIRDSISALFSLCIYYLLYIYVWFTPPPSPPARRFPFFLFKFKWNFKNNKKFRLNTIVWQYQIDYGSICVLLAAVSPAVMHRIH